MQNEPVGIFEFNAKKEWYYYYIVKNDNKLSFGTVSNCGFMERGYLTLDNSFSLDEHLQCLVEDVKNYFKNGITPSKTVINELEV